MNQLEVRRIERGGYQIGEGQSIDRLPLDILTWDGTERRKHLRFKVKWNGTLESVSSKSQARIQVRLMDISEGGCCIRLDRRSSGSILFSELGLHDRFELTVYLNGAMARILVEVRWYMPVSDGVYGAGLEFITMTKATRSLIQIALQRLGS